MEELLLIGGMKISGGISDNDVLSVNSGRRRRTHLGPKICRICENLFFRKGRNIQTGYANHFKVVGRDGDGGHAPQVGEGLSFWILQFEAMKQGGKKHEKFFLGQLISETHSLTNTEGEKMLWFDDT